MVSNGPNESEALAILGLEKNATLEEKKRIFKSLTRKYHPDLNDGDDKKFKMITQAYAVLTADPSKQDADSPPPNPFADLDDWAVASDEGIKISKPGDGKDIDIKIKVDSKLALLGGQKAISYTVSGARRSFKIKIPMGTSNGKKIRVAGKGYPGILGGKAGDLYILVEVEVESFKNDGDSFSWGNDIDDGIRIPIIEDDEDFEISISIDANLASTGGQKAISYSINGAKKSFKVQIPAGTRDGQRIRVAGRGYPNASGGVSGDLNVHIVVAKPVRGRDINAYATIKASHALALMFSGKTSVPIRDFDTGIYIKNFDSLDRSHRDGVVYPFKGVGGKGEKGFEDGDLYLHVHFTEGAKASKLLIPGIIAIAIVIGIAVNNNSSSDNYVPSDVTYDQNTGSQGSSDSNGDTRYTEDPYPTYDPNSDQSDPVVDEGATGGIGDTTDETGSEIQPDSGSTEDPGATGAIG